MRANPEAERIFYTSLPDLRGTDHDLFPPETAAQFTSNEHAAMTTPAGIQTVEHLAAEDRIHESIVSKFPIPDEHGTPTLIGGIAIDITGRTRPEAALRESEEHTLATIRTSLDAVVVIDDSTILE